MPLLLQEPALGCEALGLIPVSVESLEEQGFTSCIVDGRPCRGATVLDPTYKKHEVLLCCVRRHERVSTDDAPSCALKG